ELGHDPAAARVSRLEGSADRIDESIRFAEENILPSARRLDGWRGVLSFVDRRSGAVMLITFWESQEAMRRSEEQADQLRSKTAGAASQTIAGVERYEVVMQEVAAGARR